MDQEQVLLKLKKDVRSLLLSSKVGLDPEQLKRDYISMLGQPMPLRQLGFRNIMDMVKDMPDAVTILFRPDGAVFLRAASDETTRNIEVLVSRQRISVADKKRLQKRPTIFFPQYNHHRSYSCGPSPSALVLPRRGRAPPALPSQLRAQLRSLLAQGPLQLSQLESSFLRCCGHPLRVQSMGYYSTAEMLEAASDLVVLNQSRTGSMLSLREQMLPRPLCTATRALTSPGAKGQSRPQPNQQPLTVKVSRTQCPERPPLELAQTHREDSIGSMPELIENADNQWENHHEDQQKGQAFIGRMLQLEEEFLQQIQHNGVAGTISPDLKERLQKVVAQCPRGVSVHEVPAKYKTMFGEELPLLESGFVSVTELIGAMTDLFHLQDECGDWTVRGKEDRDAMDTADESPSDGFKLPPVSFYFSSGASPWEGHKEEEEVEAATAPEATDEPETTLQPQETTYPLIQVQPRPSVPLDALLSHRLQRPTPHAVRELVSVFVEEVESPSSFYIRFSSTGEARTMEDMMIQMRRCYMCPEVSARYRLPQRFVRRGQVCCVSPKGMWFYRVVIHAVLSPASVEVYYADFGAVTTVPTSQLKFLKSCYSVLPAQAIPSSLVCIKPATGLWTPQDTEVFQQLCCDKTLVGVLDSYSGDVLLLYLCDTHTEQDVYLHSALIQRGTGEACSAASSQALCPHVTPVSLYLGEGMIELPELELLEPHSLQEQDQQEVEEEELPGLEYIEDCDTSPPQAPDSFLEWALKEELPQTQAPSPMAPDLIQPPSPMAPDLIQAPSPMAPDLIQAPVSALCESRDHQLVVALSPQPPLPLLRTLSLHTPDLGQRQCSPAGSPVSPLLQFKGLFPLFGRR